VPTWELTACLVCWLWGVCGLGCVRVLLLRMPWQQGVCRGGAADCITGVMAHVQPLGLLNHKGFPRYWCCSCAQRVALGVISVVSCLGEPVLGGGGGGIAGTHAYSVTEEVWCFESHVAALSNHPASLVWPEQGYYMWCRTAGDCKFDVVLW
jgi:hypothetical protein